MHRLFRTYCHYKHQSWSLQHTKNRHDIESNLPRKHKVDTIEAMLGTKPDCLIEKYIIFPNQIHRTPEEISEYIKKKIIVELKKKLKKHNKKPYKNITYHLKQKVLLRIINWHTQ